MEMRKIMLVAAALMAGAVGLNGTAAQQTQQQGSEGEMEVTGMVTEAGRADRGGLRRDREGCVPPRHPAVQD
jgi:hypothetical protein